MTTERQWNRTTGVELSITSTVSAGIPIVASGSIETKLSVSEVYSFNRSEKLEVTREINHEITCPAHQEVYAEATTYQDKLNLPYTGELEVELMNGEKFSYPVKGVYKGTSVRSVFINFTYSTKVS